jgi:hypothetical protein
MYNPKEFLYEILVNGEATAFFNLSYDDSDNLVCDWVCVGGVFADAGGIL